MPNYIQYSTTTPSGSLKKGNAALGITDEVTGPTSTTGWYSGINPPTGSYTVYEVAASGDPDIYCPQNTTELLNLVKSKGATGGNTGSVAAALAWIATQPNLLATNEVYPNIITSGSVLMLDAGFVGSYPTTASTWYDISGNNNSGSLVNGPTYNPIGGITFDGVDDYVNIPGNATNNFQPTNSFTINAIFKPIGIGSPTAVIDNTSVVLGTGVTAGSYGIGLNYNQIAGTYNLRIGCRSTDNIFLTTDYPITLNTIYDVSLTYQTNGIQYIYVNGVQINSQSTVVFSSKSLTPSTTYGFNIFRNYPVYGGNGRYGIGSFYKGLIYNRALSQAEINQNYYQAPIVTNGLIFSVDANNLVSYESGSTTTYSLTGSISGSLINGTGFTNNNGGAWNFDGTDDYITLGTQTLVTNDFSLNIWFNSTSNVAKEHFIISFGYSSSPSFLITQDTQNNGQSLLTVYYSVNGVVTGRQINTNIIPNTSLINLCFVRQNGVNTPYINGVPQTNRIFTENVTLGSLTYVLGWAIPRNKSTAYMQGNIYNCSIYNRALTAAEVSQNFNAQRNRFNI